MNFVQRLFGPSPEPLPDEDNKAIVNAESRSSNLVFMGKYCCFCFVFYIIYEFFDYILQMTLLKLPETRQSRS